MNGAATKEVPPDPAHPYPFISVAVPVAENTIGQNVIQQVPGSGSNQRADKNPFPMGVSSTGRWSRSRRWKLRPPPTAREIQKH